MKKLLLIILLISFKRADAQIISTIAGNGIQGDSGDAGAAISCTLSWPDGIAVDQHGNLFIANSGSNSIRKVNAGTGIINTIAGDDTAGYSGDGGLAINARLNGPVGITIDTSGNLFIADQYNQCIRKITASTGIITTIAGNTTQGYSGDNGPAINAEFNTPTGIAIDKYQNLYIADAYNQCIRKISAISGIITTVAGNGNVGFSGDGGQATSAIFNVPFGVAVDTLGNIYVADYQNFRVRKVDFNTGIINTIAGNNTPAFSGDGGLAINSGFVQPFCIALDKYQNIYIADEMDNRIRKITSSTNVITTVAGNGTAGYNGDGIIATTAEINNPQGVTIDTAGNVYIADLQNHRVRMVSNSGSTYISYLNNTSNQIIVYPNPTSDQFFVETNTADNLNVDLFDVNGRHVFSANVSNKENLNVATLDNGAYSLTIKTADRIINKKLVILR